MPVIQVIDFQSIHFKNLQWYISKISKFKIKKIIDDTLDFPFE